MKLYNIIYNNFDLEMITQGGLVRILLFDTPNAIMRL